MYASMSMYTHTHQCRLICALLRTNKFHKLLENSVVTNV